MAGIASMKMAAAAAAFETDGWRAETCFIKFGRRKVLRDEPEHNH